MIDSNIQLQTPRIPGNPVIVAAQYSAILDDVVCELCEELDGMILDINNPDYIRFTPPIHARCRCLWVYIDEREFPPNREPDWVTPNDTLIKKHGQWLIKAAPKEVHKKMGKWDIVNVAVLLGLTEEEMEEIEAGLFEAPNFINQGKWNILNIRAM